MHSDSRPADATVPADTGPTTAPGAVNAHTHVYSGLAPLGIPPPRPEPETFLHILERLWWRLDRALDPDSLRAAARLYVAEALLAGTTTLIDHHESPEFIEGSLDLLADVCDELGIRAVLCYGATERNGGREEAQRGLLECRRFIRDNTRPTVRGVVALHAAFTVSDETVRQAGELCRELDSVLHVHLAEARSDVDDARARGYAGPLERLLELGALPPGSILAHGVHLSEEQVRRAADNGLWFVQNPRSNRGNRVGYASSLAASRRVAVGTDGYPARMEDEAAALLELAAEHGDDPAGVVSRLAAGHFLATELLGDDITDDLVETDGERVRRVVVAGRTVVEDGRLTAADLEEIRATAARQAPRLWGRMAALPLA